MIKNLELEQLQEIAEYLEISTEGTKAELVRAIANDDDTGELLLDAVRIKLEPEVAKTLINRGGPVTTQVGDKNVTIERGGVITFDEVLFRAYPGRFAISNGVTKVNTNE